MQNCSCSGWWRNGLQSAGCRQDYILPQGLGHMTPRQAGCEVLYTGQNRKYSVKNCEKGIFEQKIRVITREHSQSASLHQGIS